MKPTMNLSGSRVGLLSGIVLVLFCCTGSDDASAQTTCPPGSASRTAAGGTWTIAIANTRSGYSPTVTGVLHLAGSDAAVTGGWVTNEEMQGGGLTGELHDGVLRIELGGPGAVVMLVDATLASDGKTATGAVTGWYSGSITLTRR